MTIMKTKSLFVALAIANWYEAKQYHLHWYSDNCGLAYSRRGPGPGMCPDCFSRAVIRLCEVWDDLDDPWTSAWGFYGQHWSMIPPSQLKYDRNETRIQPNGFKPNG